MAWKIYCQVQKLKQYKLSDESRLKGKRLAFMWAISNPCENLFSSSSQFCCFSPTTEHTKKRRKSYIHKKMSCKFHCIFQTQPHEAVKKREKRFMNASFFYNRQIFCINYSVVCYVDIQAENSVIFYFQHNPCFMMHDFLLFNIARDIQKWIFTSIERA